MGISKTTIVFCGVVLGSCKKISKWLHKHARFVPSPPSSIGATRQKVIDGICLPGGHEGNGGNGENGKWVLASSVSDEFSCIKCNKSYKYDPNQPIFDCECGAEIHVGFDDYGDDMCDTLRELFNDEDIEFEKFSPHYDCPDYERMCYAYITQKYDYSRTVVPMDASELKEILRCIKKPPEILKTIANTFGGEIKMYSVLSET